MTTLYDLTYEIATAGEKIESVLNNPELSQEEKDRLVGEEFDALETAQLSLPDKMEGCWKYVRSLESDEASIAREIAALEIKKKAISDARERFKGYMLRCVRMAKDGKCKTPLVSMWIGHSDKAVVTDEQKLPTPKARPDLYKFTPPEIKIGELKKALKAGEKIEGVKIITSEHLVMK